jgi:hypothetical protein
MVCKSWPYHSIWILLLVGYEINSFNYSSIHASANHPLENGTRTKQKAEQSNKNQVLFHPMEQNKTKQKINLFSIHYYSLHKVKQTKPNPKKLAPFSSLHPSIH